MDAPKVSVLIPLYNRRHYIEDCINSVLIQTLRDFEIIVCDDCSTDGSADFVEQRFADEISADKLKLRRNKRNLGEHLTVEKLIHEAAGKYFMILHSDDLYLPHALEHMYAVAEKFQADVVHAGTFLQSPEDGSIDTHTQFKLMCWENRVLENFEVVPPEPETRFKAWANADIFVDMQYNIHNRAFVFDNDISVTGGMLFILHCLMAAKVFVRTPAYFYIRRDAPDSLTNDKTRLEKKLHDLIKNVVGTSRCFDKLFRDIEYFSDNKAIQYSVRAIFYNRYDVHWSQQRDTYKDGITPGIHRAVESAFKEIFGGDVGYLTFLFHKVHCLPFEQDFSRINSATATLKVAEQFGQPSRPSKR